MPIVQFETDVTEPAKLKTAVPNTLVEGHKTSVWFKHQQESTLHKLIGEVRKGIVNGESSDEIARRIGGGTLNGVPVPGVMKTTRRQAVAIGRTAVNAVQTKARMEAFKEHDDVVKGFQQISTLDSRTSDICMAYSGEAWDLEGNPMPPSTLPFNGGPPRHFNCRSSLVPVLKSFNELGIDLEEVPPSTRASMDGQVPGDITFDSWLKGKADVFQDEMLGPARAALWRKGKITLKQLVDMRGDPLTLDQLEALVAKGLNEPLGATGSETFDLKLYHGTGKKFKEFDENRVLTGADKGGESFYGKGVYLTGEPWKGSMYAYGAGLDKGLVYEVTAHVKNPLVVKGTDPSALNDALRGVGLDTSLTGNQLAEALQALDYDSVLVYKKHDSKIINELVVFRGRDIEIDKITPVKDFDVSSASSTELEVD